MCLFLRSTVLVLLLAGAMPLMSTAGVRSNDLWPRGELGSLIRGWGYLHPPQDILTKIAEFNLEHCRELLSPPATALGIDWLDRSCDALSRRDRKSTRLNSSHLG